MSLCQHIISMVLTARPRNASGLLKLKAKCRFGSRNISYRNVRILTS